MCRYPEQRQHWRRCWQRHLRLGWLVPPRAQAASPKIVGSSTLDGEDKGAPMSQLCLRVVPALSAHTSTQIPQLILTDSHQHPACSQTHSSAPQPPGLPLVASPLKSDAS